MAESGDASPLLRLATTPSGGTPFLTSWHLASAVRLEKLLFRAQMVPRLTMSYNPAAVGGQGRSMVARLKRPFAALTALVEA